MYIVQVIESTQYCFGDFAKDIHSYGTEVFGDAIEGSGQTSETPGMYLKQKFLPAIHILHTHDHIPRVVEECTVKGNDIGRSAIMHDV